LSLVGALAACGGSGGEELADEEALGTTAAPPTTAVPVDTETIGVVGPLLDEYESATKPAEKYAILERIAVIAPEYVNLDPATGAPTGVDDSQADALRAAEEAESGSP
jgi:hypothetical protein